MLEKIDRVDAPNEHNPTLKLRFEPNIKSGEEVLKVKNLVKSFDEEILFKDLSFDIFRGEKIGLIGPNGVGKTTLFKIILGELGYDSGEVSIGHNVYTGYFDQEQQKLNPDNTVFDEILEIIPRATNTEIRSKLGLFLFMGDDVFKTIDSLSGGEKGRLSLLKLVLSDSNFILLDEPTNHLDIRSKEVLEEALNNYNGTLLIISHDRYFLNKVTNKTFEFNKDKIQTYLGNYDYYINKKKTNESLFKVDAGPTKTKTELKKERQERKEVKREVQRKKERMAKVLKEIEAYEKKLHENEKEMCLEEVYSDGEKVKEINDENQALETTINKLYEEWGRLDKHLENL